MLYEIKMFPDFTWFQSYCAQYQYDRLSVSHMQVLHRCQREGNPYIVDCSQ